MMGGDELTEGYLYEAASYDDDFPCESEEEGCADTQDGRDAISPFTALHCAVNFLAGTTSRQR